MVAILRNAQRIGHIGNWEWDIKRNSLWWSAEVYRVVGLDPTRFSASYESYLVALHPDDRDRVLATVSASMEDKVPYTIEHRIVLPDGREMSDFMDLVDRIKAGDKTAGVAAGMRALAAKLLEKGAVAIVAGCTEVPLVLDEPLPGTALISSTDLLAQATVDAALAT